MNSSTSSNPILARLEQFSVNLDSTHLPKHILHDISFSINKAEIVGLVGHSGSGKSVLARALLGLLPRSMKCSSGNIFYADQMVGEPNGLSFDALRGRKISMIFQEAVAALNPVFMVGLVLSDVIRHHFKISKNEAREIALQHLAAVGFIRAEETFRSYPHQLSGGMAQRVCIALALACQPELLIADEPTTALDVAAQNQILRLILKLQQQSGFALLLISHDMTLVANLCEQVIVLKEGAIAAQGEPENIRRQTSDEYITALFSPLTVTNFLDFKNEK